MQISHNIKTTKSILWLRQLASALDQAMFFLYLSDLFWCLHGPVTSLQLHRPTVYTTTYEALCAVTPFYQNQN